MSRVLVPILNFLPQGDHPATSGVAQQTGDGAQGKVLHENGFLLDVVFERSR